MPHHSSNIGTSIASPFMSCIVDCRARMKKLRKKIYKNLKAKPNSGPSQFVSQDLPSLIREERVPAFIVSVIRQQPGGTALQDITNLMLPDAMSFEHLRDYADQQQTEIQNIIEKMHHEPHSDSFSEEELSGSERMKSWRWLQSTEIQVEEDQLLERHSLVSVRPFGLFGGEGDSVSSVRSQLDPLKVANGFLSMESQSYMEHNLFPF